MDWHSLRYIFYSHDQNQIIKDFEGLGFETLVYKDTTTTITIYFGSKIGLQSGFSIKARLYTNNRIQNIWDINQLTKFNLLEIKSSISTAEALIRGRLNQNLEIQTGLIENVAEDQSKDIIFRIQRASEDGLLQDSTFKLKSKLDYSDFQIPNMYHI